MAYQTPQNSTGAGGVTLGARIDIFPSMPLPELDTPGGKAYAARYKSEASSDLYAIICQSALPPRIDAITGLRSLDNPSLVRFIDSGVVTWADNARAYAFVYQRPLAPQMINNLDETRTPLSEDAIHHHFITPMIGALNALMVSGVAHNAIRPNNIFWRIGNAAPPQIGECLSTPAGMGQPVAVEPIERAMALPLGRGTGSHADDCYAFGVVLAFLVLGRNPFQGMDDAAIIDLKMQRGSFAAIVGNSRLSPAHIEILRGLLSDDARQRWTASNLEQWLNGRRMTPKGSDAGRRATRHFDFMGSEYWQAAPLAGAMAANVTDAAKIIENDSLGKWLRRSLNDEERANDVANVVNELKQSGKSSRYEDQLVTRVCIVLDRAAPIRYRGLSVMPGGIAPLLAEAAATPGSPNIQLLSEIIASQLPALWVDMQKDPTPDQVALIQTFDRMKGFLEKAAMGNGIERVTYELNPGLPCLSPILRGQYVATPKMLLSSLERVAANGNRPREPIDRHIAAFLIVRDKRGENMFAPMTAPEGSVRRGLGLLALFAELQYRHGPENTPQLAGWLSPVVEPALRRFLGKALREHLQKQAKEAVATGNLGAMLRLIDDPRRLETDRQEFIAARLLYLSIQKEIAGLESTNRDSVMRGSGKAMAANISSLLAIILICAAILRAMAGALFQ
ncbi:MAG: serine/threonine protein kinase [Alphaproteobacteria bacterium]|nr:serine/threonine protein kinase [Alphaproteobacteria bacterium]